MNKLIQAQTKEKLSLFKTESFIWTEIPGLSMVVEIKESQPMFIVYTSIMENPGCDAVFRTVINQNTILGSEYSSRKPFVLGFQTSFLDPGIYTVMFQVRSSLGYMVNIHKSKVMLYLKEDTPC